ARHRFFDLAAVDWRFDKCSISSSADGRAAKGKNRGMTRSTNASRFTLTPVAGSRDRAPGLDFIFDSGGRNAPQKKRGPLTAGARERKMLHSRRCSPRAPLRWVCLAAEPLTRWLF